MKKTIEESKEKTSPLVAVVDDDESMREALRSLLESVGLRAAVFASAEDYTNSGRLDEANCLILDVRMPGMNGLELQRRLIAKHDRVPIIFISGHRDADEKVRAMTAGAIDFLDKPFSEKALLDAVDAAVNFRDG